MRSSDAAGAASTMRVSQLDHPLRLFTDPLASRLPRATSGPMDFTTGAAETGYGFQGDGHDHPIHTLDGFGPTMTGIDVGTECIPAIGAEDKERVLAAQKGRRRSAVMVVPALWTALPV